MNSEFDLSSTIRGYAFGEYPTDQVMQQVFTGDPIKTELLHQYILMVSCRKLLLMLLISLLQQDLKEIRKY